MAEFFIRIWRALTATGRLLFLGATEAWGFWSTTLLLLSVVFFAVHIAGGITWRLIEGRLRPKLRDEEVEALLRAEIRGLKVELYDNHKERTRLALENSEQARIIEAWRNWSRNMNADAHQIMRTTARKGA
jgi:hypothetical protein